MRDLHGKIRRMSDRKLITLIVLVEIMLLTKATPLPIVQPITSRRTLRRLQRLAVLLQAEEARRRELARQTNEYSSFWR
jgi:hypothetical protein